MAWTDPNTHIFVTGEILSSTTMNTFCKNNLLDLHRRTDPAYDFVSINEFTNSTSFGNLTTVGPTVQRDIGQVGLALVSVMAWMTASVASHQPQMGFQISGASTRAPTQERSAGFNAPFGFNYFTLGTTVLEDLLNPGLTTFQAKYKITDTGANAHFFFRRIIAQPLGS